MGAGVEEDDGVAENFAKRDAKDFLGEDVTSGGWGGAVSPPMMTLAAHVGACTLRDTAVKLLGKTITDEGLGRWAILGKLQG